MRCKRIQNLLSNCLEKDNWDIPEQARLHLDSCQECSAFAQELSLLQGALNKSKVDILPGELDDLTFDKIVMDANRAPGKAYTIHKINYIRWLWAPAAAAVVIIAAFFAARWNTIAPDPYVAQNYAVYDSQELIEEIAADDSLQNQVILSLAEDDSDLESAAELLLSGADLDLLIDAMTDEELNMFYNKIDKLEG